MRNCLVAQSGGPTVAINASLAGVIQGAIDSKEFKTVYGSLNGVQGLLNGRLMDLTKKVEETPMFIELLKKSPSMYLGSCRYQLPHYEEDDAPYAYIFKKFKEYEIDAFFYIGGNDSMDTVMKLDDYAKYINSDIHFIGIPKTIDNDLVLTDHTPGFGSAAKYVATTVREIVLDANVYEKKSVTIIEIMGRHAGWLTAASVLARKSVGDNPLLIYLPETAFDEEAFLKKVEACFEKNLNVVVCVSEGIHDKDGVFICEYDNAVGTDTFGHKMLAGCGKYLENLVRNRLGVKARSVELNVSQRCSSSMMSKTDQKEAVSAGEFGVRLALKGETGKMVSYIRISNLPYAMKLGLEDVNEICNKEKTVPLSWITNEGSDIGEEFIFYALPLVQGQVEVPVGTDGLAKFVSRK